MNPRVTWSSLESSVADVDAGGRVRSYKKGTANVTATAGTVSDTAQILVQADAPATASVIIVPDNDTIPTIGGNTVLTAIVLDAAGNPVPGAVVVWSSLNPSIASVNSSGLVSGLASGLARITATNNTTADTALVWVAPAPPPASLTVTPALDSVAVAGGTKQFTATVKDASGATQSVQGIAWQSLDGSIASVDGSGKATGLSKGTARIVASYQSVADTSLFKVNLPPQSTRLEINPAADTIPSVGGNVTLTAVVYDETNSPMTASITWGSLDPTIAVITGPGQVAGVAKGIARITAKSGSLADTALVWVAPAPAGSGSTFYTEPNPMLLDQVGSMWLVIGKLDSAGVVRQVVTSFTSTNSGVVSVDANGWVKAITQGTAQIIGTYNGKKDTTDVKVGGLTTSTFRITVDLDTLDFVGDTVRLKAEAFDPSGAEILNPLVTWSSTASSIATVSGTNGIGKVTAIAAGTAKIVAKRGTFADTATIVVRAGSGGTGSVTVTISPSMDTIPAVGQTIPLAASVRDAQGNLTSNQSVTWSSLDVAYATVSSSGVVTGVASGMARIRAMQGSVGDTAWVLVAPTTASLNVTVTPKMDTIPAVNQTIQLAASVRDAQGNLTSNQSVTWSSLDLVYATVTSSGVVTGVAKGMARIRAMQGSVADTAWISVAPSTSTPPQSGLTVDLKVVRFDGGSGTILVNSGIPLPPGYLRDTQLRNLVVYVSGAEQTLYVEALKGRHPDGSIRSVQVQWRMSVPSSGTTAQLVLGPNVSRTTVDMAKTTVNYNYQQPLSTAAAALPSSPTYLTSTLIVGEISTTTFNSTWHSNFAVWGDPKYNAMMAEYYTMSGDAFVNYNYYDAVLSNFAWWVRTGNVEYWKRANYFLMPYRDGYAVPNNYGMQPHIAQIEGLETHYLLTGDAASLYGASTIATTFMGPWLPVLGDVTISWHDNRIQARILDFALTGLRLGLTTRDFAADARLALTRILSSQSADGAYRLGAHCWQDTPFMNGILNTVFIKYYTYFEQDPRIPASIKKNLDFMWSREWLAADLSFKYLEGDCPGQGGPGPAPDLNLMISNGYAWYARYSGDGTYRSKGDQIFNSGVVNAYLQGMKQFNENYHASFHYDPYRN
jgi:uncharacterized protein YjdB